MFTITRGKKKDLSLTHFLKSVFDYIASQMMLCEISSDYIVGLVNVSFLLVKIKWIHLLILKMMISSPSHSPILAKSMRL